MFFSRKELLPAAVALWCCLSAAGDSTAEEKTVEDKREAVITCAGPVTWESEGEIIRVVFDRGVRLERAPFVVTAERMTAVFPSKEHGLLSVSAEGNVRVEQDGTVMTGDAMTCERPADDAAGPLRFVLRGDPARIVRESFVMHSDEISFAEGGDAVGVSGESKFVLLDPEGNSDIEVNCTGEGDWYGDENKIALSGVVSVKTEDMLLECSELKATFTPLPGEEVPEEAGDEEEKRQPLNTGASRELEGAPVSDDNSDVAASLVRSRYRVERVEASGGVRVTADDRTGTCEYAVFDGVNKTLELWSPEHKPPPTITDGARKLSARRVRVYLEEDRIESLEGDFTVVFTPPGEKTDERERKE